MFCFAPSGKSWRWDWYLNSGNYENRTCAFWQPCSDELTDVPN